MLRVVDDNIESLYKIVPDIFDYFLESCDRFCITLLTPHGGCHGVRCVVFYGMYWNFTNHNSRP